MSPQTLGLSVGVSERFLMADPLLLSWLQLQPTGRRADPASWRLSFWVIVSVIQVLMGTEAVGGGGTSALMGGTDVSPWNPYIVAFGATVERRMVWVCPWGSRGGAGGQEVMVRNQCSSSP